MLRKIRLLTDNQANRQKTGRQAGMEMEKGVEVVGANHDKGPSGYLPISMYD